MVSNPYSLRQQYLLKTYALAPNTFTAYEREFNNFLQHTRLTPQQILSYPPALLDHLLAQYLDWLFTNQKGFTQGSHTLYALVFFRPSLHSSLRTSRLCLRGWKKMRETTSHPPLTWELTVVLASTLARWGHHGPAVAMLLAFDCYLRVGELTNIRRGDVVLPPPSHVAQDSKPYVAIRLPRTKTGPDQSVAVNRPAVAEVLRMWMQYIPPSSNKEQYVFPFSADFFRKLIHDACSALGLGHISFVPHSLRHGGATTDWSQGKKLDYVQHRGRWKALESVRRYVQVAKELQARYELPPQLIQLGRRLDRTLVTSMYAWLMEVPPSAGRRRGITFSL